MFMDNLSENMHVSIAIFGNWVLPGYVSSSGDDHLQADLAKSPEWSRTRTISLSSWSFYSQVVHLGFDQLPTSV